MSLLCGCLLALEVVLFVIGRGWMQLGMGVADYCGWTEDGSDLVCLVGRAVVRGVIETLFEDLVLFGGLRCFFFFVSLERLLWRLGVG